MCLKKIFFIVFFPFSLSFIYLTPCLNIYFILHMLQTVARDCMRAAKIGFFGEYLSGLEDPLLHWNADLHRLEPMVASDDGELEGREIRGYIRQISEVRLLRDGFKGMSVLEKKNEIYEPINV